MKDKTIMITREPKDAKEFISLLIKNGAKPIALPTIQLKRKNESIAQEFLNNIQSVDPDYSVFMSSNAVEILFETAQDTKIFDKLVLAVANTSVVAVGPKTKNMLSKYGIRTAFIPNTYSSIGIGEIFTQISAFGKKVIIPRSSASGEFLNKLLQKIGIKVTQVLIYDTTTTQKTESWQEFKSLFSRGTIDGIVYTSASTVGAFFEIMSKDYTRTELLDSLKKIHIIAIGPFTKLELTKFNVSSIMPETHTIRGTFFTLKDLFK